MERMRLPREVLFKNMLKELMTKAPCQVQVPVCQTKELPAAILTVWGGGTSKTVCKISVAEDLCLNASEFCAF